MKHFIIYICLLFTGTLWSCNDFLEVDAPKDQLMAGEAFKDETTATATVVGIYTEMNSYNYQFANVLMSFMGGMAADEIYAAFTSFDDFRYNTLGPSTSYLAQFWEQPYAYIYQANSVLEGLTKSDALQPEVKNQLLGEAHFVRAFCYFYLTNLFGDVPLVQDIDVKKNSSLPKSSSDEINKFVVEELVSARDLLQESYVSEGRVRPNKQAASALLARVYLYQENWQAAADAASLLIEDTRYQLMDNLDGVFLTDSEEAIWQLQTVNKSTAGVNTWEGFNIVPFTPGTRSYYTFTDDLMDTFEAGDQRVAHWMNTYELVNSGGEAVTYYFPYKYKYRTTTPVEEYSMVMRLGEQYLIRAEAYTQLNKTTEALKDLNAVRERAGLSLLSGLSQSELLSAIALERRHELFGEWGHRWFDLIRTGKAVEVLSELKDDFTEQDLLFPIPLEATLSNPNLK